MHAPTGWSTVRVRDLASAERHSFIDGDWIEAAFITDHGVRLIQTGNIGVGCFINKNVKYISEKSFFSLGCKDVFEGDILICRLAEPIGRSCIVPDLREQAITSVDVCILRVDESSFDKAFVAYALNQQKFLDDCVEKSAGSTRQRISRTNLGQVELLVPECRGEQAYIAEMIKVMDAAISNLQRTIDKRKRIKAGVIQDLLTFGLDKNGVLRTERTHAFKDSALGRIPEEWEVKQLGRLLSKINQGWSPACEPDPADVGEWGVLKTTAVVWEGYQELENKKLPSSFKPRPDLEIEPGDILMTRAGPNSRVGVVSYVQGTRRQLMLSDKIYRLIPKKDVDSRFLSYALSDFKSQRYLSTLKTGMAKSQTNISQSIVQSLLVTCPPAVEQEVIGEQIATIDAELDHITESLNKLLLLRTALMQDLLTGRKRVTDLLEHEARRERVYV